MTLRRLLIGYAIGIADGLPASPFVVSGMKQGWAFAWPSLMATEIFVTILTGLGLGICCNMVANSAPGTM